eukprot:COSAG04_NODE_609_length_12066_cov_55.131695_4_plen_1371_part_00
MNSAFNGKDRSKVVPFFSYLQLFVGGARRLPNACPAKLWRAFPNLDPKWKKLYPKGQELFWWAFSSTTKSSEVLMEESFFGTEGERTLFTLDCVVGIDISMYSDFPEDEVLLMPGSRFVVEQTMSPELLNGVLNVVMRQVPSRHDLLPAAKPPGSAPAPHSPSTGGETVVLIPAPQSSPATTDRMTLPHPWEEHVSRSTGDTYFYNPETEQSTYERPVAADLHQGPQTSSLAADDVVLDMDEQMPSLAAVATKQNEEKPSGGSKRGITALFLAVVAVIAVAVAIMAGGTGTTEGADCASGDGACLPLNSLTASLELDMDIASIPEGTPERASFESSFKIDTAAALGGIGPDRIRILSIQSGSIIVDFAVLPAADGTGLERAVITSSFAAGGVAIAGSTTTSAVSVTSTPVPSPQPEPEPEPGLEPTRTLEPALEPVPEQDQATCADVDGEGPESAPVSDQDCGDGFLADPSASASVCASTVCDVARVSEDKEACCVAQASCGDADGEGPESTPVSDPDCGDGFLANPSASASVCASTVCDVARVSEDKEACCAAQATCGDADGEGPESTPVSDQDCGDGFLADPSASASACASTVCDVAGVAEDQQACCVAQATCGDVDGVGPGSVSVSDADCGYQHVYQPEASAATCQGTVCDVSNVPEDKAACCVFSHLIGRVAALGRRVYGIPIDGLATTTNAEATCVAQGLNWVTYSPSYTCPRPISSPAFTCSSSTRDTLETGWGGCDNIAEHSLAAVSGEFCGECSVSGGGDPTCQNLAVWVGDDSANAMTNPGGGQSFAGELGMRALCIERIVPGTCGDKDGAGAGSDGISDQDCGLGFLRDRSAFASAAVCAGTECDTSVAADKALCCVAQARCGDANGEGAGADPVSDDACGDALVHDPSASEQFCAATVCDMTNADDRSACCAAPATCEDADGDGPGSTPVSDAQCGAGLEATVGATGSCADAVCDISGNADDKAACCTACDGTTEFATEAIACTSFTPCDNAGEGGVYSATADLSCSRCEAGQYAATSDNVCIACTGAGFVTDTLSSRGGTACTECDSGRFSTASTSACADWLSTCSNAGEGLSGGSTSADKTCEACSAGQHAATSDNECIACAGTTTASDGTTPDTDGGAAACVFGTCADTNGAAAAGATAVTDTDCGFGFLSDSSAAASLCAGPVCNIAGVVADKAACCVAQATCGDADGEGDGTDAVSDGDCGEGYLYDPSSSGSVCADTECDISGTAADRTACCVAQATCGDADGEGTGSAAVTDGDCGDGFLADPSATASLCTSTACDIAGVPEDKAACCRDLNALRDYTALVRLLSILFCGQTPKVGATSFGRFWPFAKLSVKCSAFRLHMCILEFCCQNCYS